MNEKIKIETKKIIKEYDEEKQGEIFKFEPKKNDKVLLVMGLNPGGEKKKKHDGILYFEREENEDLFDILEENPKKGKEGYLYPRYYQPFYNMMKKIDEEITMFWTYNEKETKNKIKEMIKEKCTNEEQRAELEKTFDNIFKKEKEKNKGNKENKYIMFGDLFYYHTKNHHELEKMLQEELKSYINKIIEIFIDKYQPNLILVNSTTAAMEMQRALYENYNEKEIKDILLLKKEKEKENDKYKLEDYDENKLKGNIPIVFTADTTQYLDRLSKNRLARQVKEIWEKVI